MDVECRSGDAFATDSILASLRAIKGLPIYAITNSAVESGGYLVACGAQAIYVRHTFKIGGIGCNAYAPNIRTDTVSSGEGKLGNPKANEAYLCSASAITALFSSKTR